MSQSAVLLRHRNVNTAFLSKDPRFSWDVKSHTGMRKERPIIIVK